MNNKEIRLFLMSLKRSIREAETHLDHIRDIADRLIDKSLEMEDGCLFDKGQPPVKTQNNLNVTKEEV